LELAEGKDERREILINVSHASLPPELVGETIVGTHNVVISFKDVNTKEEIGVCESTIQSVVMSDNANEIYELWTRNYNDLPEDLRAEIELKMTWVLLPSVSIVLEKMGLPPAVPPLVLSPRKGDESSVQ
jgi:hypothetical protein